MQGSVQCLPPPFPADTTHTMAFFERLSDTRYLPTEHTGGAWNIREQHIAPAIGLLAHHLERDAAARGHGFLIARLSYDILGTIPIEAMEADVQVLRAGRTIELVEATLRHDDRPALRVRAWLMRPNDTQAIAGTPIAAIAAPESMPAWDPGTVWPGGFIKSVEIRRHDQGPGRATYWARAKHALLDGEPVSPLARAATLFDLSNGMAVRADPKEVAFPNLDLTAPLFGMPESEWLSFDTSVSFGHQGLGLTSTVLHDARGPIGMLGQALTVRP
jgi:hypothetical protein